MRRGLAHLLEEQQQQLSASRISVVNARSEEGRVCMAGGEGPAARSSCDTNAVRCVVKNGESNHLNQVAGWPMTALS